LSDPGRRPTTRALSRRRLLIAGAAVGAGGGGVAVHRATRPAAGARLFTRSELRIVEAIAEVMFPGGPFPVDGLQAGVAAEVDRIVAEVLEPIHAAGFRTLLQSLEWGTLASRGRSFTALPAPERAEVLERWLDPSVFTRRLAAESFRVVLGMAYFAHPEVLAHMGWRPECGGGAT
jgi:hypothetical protein